MGGVVCVGKCLAVRVAHKLFFCWTITHRAGSDSVVKVN